MKQNKENKGKKTSAKHVILSVIGIILCIILIPILAINITLIIKSYTSSDEVPAVAGYMPMIVLTDSMYPEIESGDLIICHTAEAQDVEVGDIIAFFDPQSSSSIVSHRVIDIVTEDGEIYFETKGDNNNVADSELVPQDNLVGVCISVIAGAGNVAMFMQTTQGMILCIVCPIVLLVIYDIIRRKIYEKDKKDNTQMLLKELEELKQQKAQGAVSEPAISGESAVQAAESAQQTENHEENQ
ncbi:MAG: signal peptidase I [Clostridiales bacterium]|nr:signal peptidase I [Clostridiales bacterium]